VTLQHTEKLENLTQHHNSIM